MRQQLVSLETLWAHVRPGGVYIIEDLATSYYPDIYGGGPRGTPGTTIDTLKSAIDALNRDFVGGRTPDHDMYRVGNGNYSAFLGDTDLASVHCFRNLCALRKQRGGEFLDGQGCSQRDPLPTLNVKVPCAAAGWV